MSRGQGAGTYGANVNNSIVFSNESELLGQSLDAQMVGGSAFYSNVQGWIPSPEDLIYRNSNANPQFAALLGPDGIPGTIDDNVRLTEGSPAIDSANAPRLFADLNGNGLPEFLNFDLDDSRGRRTIRAFRIPVSTLRSTAELMSSRFRV